jgi:hypothetical protein
MSSFLQKLSIFQKVQLIFLLLILIGAPLFFFIIHSNQDTRQHASTSNLQEVESGVLIGNAKVGNDSSASGGQYVIFGQAVPTNTPVIPLPTNTPVPPTKVPTPSTPIRTTTNRTDEINGNQVQILYVLPKDGTDRNLDTNGTLATTVGAFEKWFEKESNGYKVRFDTYQGKLDIPFVRLTRTDSDLASHGVYIRDELEKEIKNSGFTNENKKYLVYYDGTSTTSCASSAHPPQLQGSVSALYLQAIVYPSSPCKNNILTNSIDTLNYWEYTGIHELFHTLGAVDYNAPHHTQSGHVSDGASDLMYAGSAAWTFPAKLDIGRDDYFGHNNPNLVDIAKSPYILPPQGN